jgi:hypothetical protein
MFVGSGAWKPPDVFPSNPALRPRSRSNGTSKSPSVACSIDVHAPTQAAPRNNGRPRPGPATYEHAQAAVETNRIASVEYGGNEPSSKVRKKSSGGTPKVAATAPAVARGPDRWRASRTKPAATVAVDSTSPGSCEPSSSSPKPARPSPPTTSAPSTTSAQPAAARAIVRRGAGRRCARGPSRAMPVGAGGGGEASVGAAIAGRYVRNAQGAPPGWRGTSWSSGGQLRTAWRGRSRERRCPDPCPSTS